MREFSVGDVICSNSPLRTGRIIRSVWRKQKGWTWIVEITYSRAEWEIGKCIDVLVSKAQQTWSFATPEQ